jgi:hypothetical protein
MNPHVEHVLSERVVPKSMLKFHRQTCVDALASQMQLLLKAPRACSSIPTWNVGMLRQKIKFYTYLHNGNRPKARAAFEKIRGALNDALTDLMFAEPGAATRVVIKNARGESTHDSEKDDANAIAFGAVAQKQIQMFEGLLGCRVE